jgi:hypothetical protein
VIVPQVSSQPFRAEAGDLLALLAAGLSGLADRDGVIVRTLLARNDT